MQLQEFKQQVKNLAVKFGLKKSQVSITADTWLNVRIQLTDLDLFKTLKSEIQALAGFQDNSDAMSDIFEHRMIVKNKCNGQFGGLSIAICRP